MKKIFLIVVTWFSCLENYGQLILTKSAHEPLVGQQRRHMNCDSVSVIPKSAGSGQIWDFSSMFPIPSATALTTYTTPVSFLVSNFPGTTIAEDHHINTFFDLWGVNDSCVFYNGSYCPSIASTIKYSDPAITSKWPFTLGNTFIDAYASTHINGIASYTDYSAGSTTTTATGAGTVILPNGKKLPNCLQITKNSTVSTTGSHTSTGTSMIYEYWSDLCREPLLTVYYGTNVTGTVVQNYAYTVLNIEALDAQVKGDSLNTERVLVFPNPVKDKLNIILPDNAVAEEIELFDVSGKLILREAKVNSLNTSLLHNGVYLLVLKNKNERFVQQVIICN